MHDTGKLKAVLKRVAQGQEDARVIGTEDCLSKILDVIDTVVLPRDVVIGNGTGQAICLTIKSRRLMRINSPAPSDLTALAVILDTQLSDDVDQLTPLIEGLTPFCAQATELSVSVSKPAKEEVLTEVGVSVDQLRKALARAGHAPLSAQNDVMKSFAEIAIAHDLDWLHLTDGEVTGSGGEAAALLSACETGLPYLLKTDKPPANHTTSWVFGTTDTYRTAIAVHGTTCLLVGLPADLTQTWIKTYANTPLG